MWVGDREASALSVELTRAVFRDQTTVFHGSRIDIRHPNTHVWNAPSVLAGGLVSDGAFRSPHFIARTEF